ncbi:biotin transporter BioY [Aquibacillus koreensis]|uniref:Biotin transporter n=1 Tax=Aquibacillus koreensis TaxID=279446 RepID=A0A9X4AHJ2_9BACI|nr:biotin transporter BioY [Aquibacillus koreensis]MCT2535689.1 biotin transporter BioY [Aquibacillus koreensis]MDC3420026.1 biotin transporter BioY [Aquibacillus koreensis]
MNYTNSKLRVIIICGIFAALTAILAQITIPIPVVPISGQTLAVGLTATIIGSRYGAIAMICYALLGAAGVPVFAGLKGGAQILLGPTGGYIFGFILTAYVTGLILEKTKYTLTMAMIANTVGMLITLIFGAIQLKFVLDYTWAQAIGTGVFPFIVVGLIKAFLASWLGLAVRKRLLQAKLLPQFHKAA